MTICGLGGCGKSALALEFAYRASAQHTMRLVLWVPAISQDSFELAYREIGIRLRIPGITNDNADIKQIVKNALSSESTGYWLMVIDNADDPGVLMGRESSNLASARLHDYLPYSSRGKILFTTRSRKVAGDLTQNNVLELNDMSKVKGEAQQLLARQIRKPALLSDEKAVHALLEILTYLPLAIVQAAAFMNHNDISASRYISLFQDAGAETELFSEHFEDPSRYQEMESTIAKTWHISFNQIRRLDPLAAEYLSFMACINRINIPQSLLPPSGSLVQQAKAIGTLTGHAFITERQQSAQVLEQQSEKFFDMHRLVHIASERWLDGHNDQKAWIAKAAERFEELIPYGGHERKEVWTTYLPHAVHVATLDGGLDEVVRASLLNRIGGCQTTLGQYSAAEMTHRKVLSLRENSLGREHDQTLTSMNEVGTALSDQGKYKAAGDMHRETLARREKVLGLEHPDTLTSMSNLALVLERQGKYEEAALLSRQTLAQYETVLGPAHPFTLISMGNLAGLLRCLGKYDEAELMYRQTLAQHKKVLGPEHLDTLKSMGNFVLVLDSQGKYGEAELMNRQTLARHENVLGPEHPDTLTSMGNLAVILRRQGKYKEAELMHRQTVVLQNKVLGPEHPGTLMSMGNLAVVLDSQGKYKEAESINRQTLSQREKVLGPEHPDTLTSAYSLAHILANQHYYSESVVLYKQAYAGYSAILGEDHPITRACQKHYSETLPPSEENRQIVPSKIPYHDVRIHTGRGSALSRGLAKMGIRGYVE
jgi:tetratricopeptide (TPR) repeat protein